MPDFLFKFYLLLQNPCLEKTPECHTYLHFYGDNIILSLFHKHYGRIQEKRPCQFCSSQHVRGKNVLVFYKQGLMVVLVVSFLNVFQRNDRWNKSSLAVGFHYRNKYLILATPPPPPPPFLLTKKNDAVVLFSLK